MLSDSSASHFVRGTTSKNPERVQVDARGPQGHHADLLLAEVAGRMSSSAR